MNLLKVAQTFATEDMALAYWIKTRWPNGVRCLACDSAYIYSITTKGKTGGRIHIFECKDCGLHFSATTGTLFHDSHLPLTKWFAAIALMCEAKKGVSANQVARHIGVSYKTAWYLCHRIRNAMSEVGMLPLGGQGKIVEIDESFIGGKKTRKGVKAGKDAKITVLGMAERNGRVHLQTISNAKAASIRPVLEANLDPETDKVVTDAAPVYTAIIPAEIHEENINKDLIRKRGFSATYTVDNALALFQRGIIGSYHKMSRDHIDSYLGEFCWRFNRRHMQPNMFDLALTNLSLRKPLPFKKLTREVF
jgi:transposase-like protein